MARVSVKVPAHTVPKQVQAAPVLATQPAPVAANPASNQKLLIGVIVGFGLILVVLLVLVLNDRNNLKQEVNKLSSSEQTSGDSNVKKYQAEISKIVELPSSKTPSLVPVKDAAKLASENAFFKRAKNGDVVLLYILEDKSVTAVLYRPSTHKVVELTSSATIGGNSATSDTTTQ